jgi:predicted nuclease of predicted toxin-antitoxin system
VRFIVDNQLPAALARWLGTKGADAVHVLARGLETTTDVDIWTLAIHEARIVVSKDEDFFHLANRPADTGRLLWVRVGNCRRDTLLARFEAAWLGIEEAFSAGNRVVMLL